MEAIWSLRHLLDEHGLQFWKCKAIRLSTLSLPWSTLVAAALLLWAVRHETPHPIRMEIQMALQTSVDRSKGPATAHFYCYWMKRKEIHSWVNYWILTTSTVRSHSSKRPLLTTALLIFSFFSVAVVERKKTPIPDPQQQLYAETSTCYCCYLHTTTLSATLCYPATLSATRSLISRVPSRGRAEAGPTFKAKIRRPGQGFGLRWLKRRKQ